MKFHSAVAALLLSLDNMMTYSASAASASASFTSHKPAFFHTRLHAIRGGEEAAATTNSVEEESLEDRVHAAMRKLGLSTPTAEDENPVAVDDETSSTAASADDADADTDADAKYSDGAVCEDGVCTIPTPTKPSVPSPNNTESFQDMKTRLAKEMDVDETIVQAAIGATMAVGTEPEEVRLDENAARAMIQQEQDAIQRVMEDSEQVQQLVSEGHDKMLSRRALAFADMDIEVARAILIADEEDAREEEEEMARLAAEREEEMARLEAEQEEEIARIKAEREEEEKRLQLRVEAEAKKKREEEEAKMPKPAPAKPKGAPPPAKKDDVIFQGTSENLQKLVLESPVPVLLDVYADWCGPCKALTPALEEMAKKGGGMFRLVKLNTDEERNISSALGVQSLPTIFGIRDGKIVHHFKGMPRDEDFMRNFMMGLMGAGDFNPKVTAKQKEEYEELSNKLIKIAGASGFSFAQRERLQVRTNDKLQELVDVRGDMADAEESAKILRSLLSNVIRDPFEPKFRKVNLENKVIAARVGSFPPAVAILKSVGFVMDKDSPTKAMVLGKGKKFVSVAPLLVARDAIDKWIDLNRRAIATAARKKKDEIARIKLLEEAEDVESDDEEEEDETDIDEDACQLKLRIQGKKKMHDLTLDADDTLKDILDALPVKVPKGEIVTIMCTARRLNVKSTDEEAMGKTLRESKLMPAASIVVKIGSGDANKQEPSTSSLKERAAARKSRTKTNTMQSTGIYSKDDNAKGELIDGGGGVWYEHDVTDDEPEEEEPTTAESEGTDEESSEKED